MRIGRSQILASKLKTELLPAPEWSEGGEVLVRALSGLAREKLDQYAVEHKGSTYSILGVLAALSIIDDEGRLEFSVDEVMELASKNQAPLDRIWDWHKQHSGIGSQALDETVKNSKPGQNGAISSVSAAASAD